MRAFALRITILAALFVLGSCGGSGVDLPLTHEQLCTDDEDDDFDGLKDCADPDCATAYPCTVHSGLCHADRVVACGQTIAGDTAGGASEIPEWGCGGEAPGPEQVAKFVSPIDGLVTVTTTAGTLIAVEGDAKGCNPDFCVADGEGLTETFQAEAGRTYWFAVDGSEAVTYALSVACEGGIAGEGLCADGKDGDGDGKFDCNDPDCAEAPWCPGAGPVACTAAATLACGETKAVASTERHVDGYRCGALQTALDMPTVDTVLRIDVPVSGAYELVATGGASLVLMVGECSSNACADNRSVLAADLARGEPVFVAVEGGKDPTVTLACPPVPAETGACHVLAGLSCDHVTSMTHEPGDTGALSCDEAPGAAGPLSAAAFTATSDGEVAFLVGGGEGTLLRSAPGGGCDPAQCVERGALLRASVIEGETLYVVGDAVSILPACAKAGQLPEVCPPSTSLECGASVTVAATTEGVSAYLCGGALHGGYESADAVTTFTASTDMTVKVAATEGTLFLLRGAACDPSTCSDSGGAVSATLAKGETIHVVADAKKSLDSVTFTTVCTPKEK